jgi:hypothetical protein
MHTAIIYYNHNQFAILYYNESDKDWETSLDRVFADSTTPNLYDAIINEFIDFLWDFNYCVDNTDFDFSKFIHNYDSNFYLVEVK